MRVPVLCVICALSAAAGVARADETVRLTAVADAFVRQDAPTLNYGGGGAVAIGGPVALNGDSGSSGRIDLLLSFDAAEVVTAFNAALGTNAWRIAGVRIELDEVAAPNNPLFPRGAGTFALSWLADDNWEEGIGSPSTPEVGFGNVITWNLLQSIVASSVERPLGQFQSLGSDGPRDYGLQLDPAFATDLRAGGYVSLHGAPISPAVGFTFHSRNFADPFVRPMLVVTAAARVRADLNCDALVNNFDIDPFVLAISDADAYAATYLACDRMNADVNLDGMVNNFDIDLFVVCISNGGCP